MPTPRPDPVAEFRRLKEKYLRPGYRAFYRSEILPAVIRRLREFLELIGRALVVLA